MDFSLMLNQIDFSSLIISLLLVAAGLSAVFVAATGTTIILMKLNDRSAVRGLPFDPKKGL